MQMHSFASGSGGNCTLVSAGNKYILVDVGVSLKKINMCLIRHGLTLADISAVFITHEHRDHVGALPMLEKNTEIPVITSEGTARGVIGTRKITGKNFSYIRAGETIEIEGIAVTAFSTPHDAAESFGYTFEHNGNKAAIVTDLGQVTDEVREAVCGAGIVLLEANHDEHMLRLGPYPWRLQKRIMGPEGHLSNRAAGELALEAAKHGVKHIMLAHLSEENNTPRLAYKTVSDILLSGGIRPGALKLAVAAPEMMSDIMEI